MRDIATIRPRARAAARNEKLQTSVWFATGPLGEFSVKTSVLLLTLCVVAGTVATWGDDLLPAPAGAPGPAAQSPSADAPPAAAPLTGAVQDALTEARAACATDIQNLCAGVEPGGGRILACLKQHKAQVSDPCRQAVAKALMHRN
jgi:hypothetical protein